MIEQKEIIADTIYKTSINDDSVISIITKSASSTPNLVEIDLNINPIEFHVNNKGVKCGELCLVLKNTLKKFSFEINDFGELIVNGEDADNFSIDENGNLIYTYR